MSSPTAALHDHEDEDEHRDGTMVSFPTLDLLLVTFNCAKSAIDVAVFATRLQTALRGQGGDVNASGTLLPDVVVFSLQEFAPLGHAFVGSYFLSPYLARFEEALNQAAAAVEGGKGDAETATETSGEQAAAADDSADVETPLVGQTSTGGPKAFRLVRQANVGMTGLLLFARNVAAIAAVEVAECGFGVADMGNKGAVGVRMAYRAAPGDDASELTFVATHLAAMEWNAKRRDANWRSIVAGLTFGDPQTAVLGTGPGLRPGPGRRHDEAASAPRSAEEEAEADAAEAAGDDAWLLLGQHGREGDDGAAAPDAADVRRRLQDMSIFRPDSLLFVAGDLNYRIDAARPPPDAVFPTAETWPDFLARDQLTLGRRAGRTFHGMHEAPIRFPPTYKYDVLDDGPEAEAEAQNAAEVRAWRERHAAQGAHAADDAALAPVPCKYATHRWPSWCDRVLYLDVPAAVQRQWPAGAEKTPAVEVRAYTSLPLMRTSDHQPVYLRARVPLLGRAGAAIREEESTGADAAGDTNGATSTDTYVDPREHLPVPIDPAAWQRRVQARRREILAGCGMLLFNTPGGAVVVATAVVLVVGAYWVWVGLL